MRSPLATAMLTIACGLLLSNAARGDVIFSNLGPGDSFQSFNVNVVEGPDVIGGKQDLAGSFTVGSTAVTLDTAELPVSGGSGTVNVQIWSDSSGSPGSVLATTPSSDAPSFPATNLTVIDFSAASLTLSANTTYWLAATGEGTVRRFWHYNDTGDEGLATRTQGGWDVFSDFTALAFRINSPGGSGDVDGDHNGDGSVDAADYVAWRKGFGTIYDESHYTAWRSNFGATSSSTAAGHLATVPEPSPLLLALLGAVAGLLRRADIRMSRSWIRENSADC